MARVRTVLHNEAGFSLFATFLIAILLVSLGSGSIIATILDLKGTSHYKTGNQALATAEAGALHAIRAANTSMILDFEDEVIDEWDDLMGTDWYTMPANENLTYRAELLDNQSWCPRSSRQGPIRITGRAPNEAERQIELCLQRAPFNFNWGAIYLANDTIDPDVNGNALAVSGFDHDIDGDPADNGVAVPGVGLRTDSAEQDLRDGITDQQADNFEGSGDEPPSVHSSGGPTPEDLFTLTETINTLGGGSTTTDDNASVNNAGGAVTWVTPTGGCTVSGDPVYGTEEAPQITLIDVDGSGTINNVNCSPQGGVTFTGTPSGTGILLVDGNVTINGNVNWDGWIITTGTLTLSGDSMVDGSVWAAGIDFDAQGHLTANFCTYCLALAIGNLDLDQFPSHINVTTWRENTWWETDEDES
jgi:hypothetical protein